LSWKFGKITALFKSGNRSDPKNYRPITVLPTVSKILERALHCQLYKYLTVNKILTSKQFGFRPKLSTSIRDARLFLFGTHDFFLGTHDFFLGTHYFLPTTHDFLPTTHDFLPTTFYPRPTTFYPRLLASPVHRRAGCYSDAISSCGTMQVVDEPINFIKT
jgi:hypothetical protein